MKETESRRPSARIVARVTIEGPAEEILTAARNLRGGKRAVYLQVEVPLRHYYDADHHLPEIKDGQTHAALQKLEMLSRQAIIDDETERRLERLIKEFAEFTAA